VEDRREVVTRPLTTLCVITKDEEDRIAGCLDSAGVVDRMLVLDSGSTDRTREIAASRGARVEVHDFDGHVEQKNRAVDLAETEWVLCLDADERLSPELSREIGDALARPDLPAAFSMPRRNRYLGRWIRHGGWYPDRKVRLFDRRRARWGGVNPHDHVQVSGPVRELGGDILHHTYRSVSDHLRQIDLFTTISSRELAAKGRSPRLTDLLVRPIWKFLRMYVLKAGFLDGRAGFVVAVLGGYYVFLKYAKHWELTRVRRDA
jgi:glycosyltransferase involved in cell wall biosynthesis